MSEHDQEPRGGPLPPVIVLAAVALMLCLHFALPVANFLSVPWRVGGGVVFVVAGAVLNIWADQLFKNANTAVRQFEPSTSLVLRGPFMVSRNPMYLGMVLLLVGIAATLGSATPWLVIPFFAWHITQRFIVAEEQKLAATFGSSYSEYKDRVRRWL